MSLLYLVSYSGTVRNSLMRWLCCFFVGLYMRLCPNPDYVGQPRTYKPITLNVNCLQSQSFPHLYAYYFGRAWFLCPSIWVCPGSAVCRKFEQYFNISTAEICPAFDCCPNTQTTRTHCEDNNLIWLKQEFNHTTKILRKKQYHWLYLPKTIPPSLGGAVTPPPRIRESRTINTCVNRLRAHSFCDMTIWK